MAYHIVIYDLHPMVPKRRKIVIHKVITDKETIQRLNYAIEHKLQLTINNVEVGVQT